MALRMMHKKHDEFLKQAEELQDYVDTKFRDEVLFEGFCNSIHKPDPELEEWLKKLEEE